MKKTGCVLLFALSLTGCSGEASAPSGPVLEKVVLLSRHGIRSPTTSPASLKAKTGFDWPEWSVAPGEMTPHGAAALGAMVQAVRSHYLRLAFGPLQNCSDRIRVWADGADHRTQQTGQVWARDVAPDCHVKAQWQAQGPDPVYNAIAAGRAVPPRQETEQAFASALPVSRTPEVQRGLQALQTLMAPGACEGAERTSHCLRDDAVLDWKKAAPHLSGGVATGGMAAESLLLLYSEGFSDDVFGSARADVPGLLKTVMPVHEAESLLLRRLPVVAQARNGVMAQSIRAFLADRPVEDIPGITPSARLLVLAGHDTNQDAMAAIFGLSWAFEDQPDSTAPDTVLAFERWRYPDRHVEVRVRIFHQSLEELRAGQASSVERSMQTLEPSNPILP
ncbi:phosphoanhydride phosphohydrolase [Gluconobacter oxydans]|uniref:Phosphoanhydride phosphohydrolase n=2 Tax=Gluconobacter oxydans TaxID=442 RepID=A0AB34XLD2_GLUOY|nr:histidine-type phosphatase [Gluconobacter oxydans]AHK71050.1 putative phosphatase AppA [Gluconobacter oxydans DSM 3504]KXV08135.1 phosphoanhydride phosphohydrolase [Gluconobacter oxydans]